MVSADTFDDPHSGRDLARQTDPFIVTFSDLYIASQSDTKIHLDIYWTAQIQKNLNQKIEVYGIIL